MTDRTPAIQGLTTADIDALNHARISDPEWGAVENIQLYTPTTAQGATEAIDFDYHRPCGQLLLKGNRTVHREICPVLNWPMQVFRFYTADHEGKITYLSMQSFSARMRAEAIAQLNDILKRDGKEQILWDKYYNVYRYQGTEVHTDTNTTPLA